MYVYIYYHLFECVTRNNYILEPGIISTIPYVFTVGVYRRTVLPSRDSLLCPRFLRPQPPPPSSRPQPSTTVAPANHAAAYMASPLPSMASPLRPLPSLQPRPLPWFHPLPSMAGSRPCAPKSHGWKVQIRARATTPPPPLPIAQCRQSRNPRPLCRAHAPPSSSCSLPSLPSAPEGIRLVLRRSGHETAHAILATLTAIPFHRSPMASEMVALASIKYHARTPPTHQQSGPDLVTTHPLPVVLI
jgi:hypothetical protein